jgi:hypothetical protein
MKFLALTGALAMLASAANAADSSCVDMGGSAAPANSQLDYTLSADYSYYRQDGENMVLKRKPARSDPDFQSDPLRTLVDGHAPIRGVLFYVQDASGTHVGTFSLSNQNVYSFDDACSAAPNDYHSTVSNTTNLEKVTPQEFWWRPPFQSGTGSVYVRASVTTDDVPNQWITVTPLKLDEFGASSTSTNTTVPSFLPSGNGTAQSSTSSAWKATVSAGLLGTALWFGASLAALA